MWANFKRTNGQRGTKVQLLKTSNGTAATPEAIVEALNSHFATAGDTEADQFDQEWKETVDDWLFSVGDGTTFANFPENEKELPENAQITDTEVRHELRNLKSASSEGPDSVHNMMLRNGGQALTSSLTRLFGVSWEAGILPLGWKRKNIVPVEKRANPSECTHYRPIALLSCVGKIMERIVGFRLSFMAESRGWHSEHQGCRCLAPECR